MSQYNLIEEPWIPVRDLVGNRRELGILEVLTSAEELATIEDPSPLVTASLHRFLLAVLYRALKGPCDIDEGKKLFREGLPKDKIKAYLEKWRPRFDLFDEKYPFGQIPNFVPKTWRSWTALATEHNADNAKVLFDHVDITASGSINPSTATRWLLATNTFVVSSGKSELTHTGTAPSAGFVMAFPIGKTLLDTLLFCLPPQSKEISTNDFALWEQEPPSIDELKVGIERPIFGYADLYTWRSRSIKLEQDGNGNINYLAFASGIKNCETAIVDPNIAYTIIETRDRETKEKIKKKVSIHLNDDKDFWRYFDSLLPDNSNLHPIAIENSVELTKNIKERLPKGVMVIGQRYYPPRPNIAYWRKEYFVLPSSLSGDNFIRGDIHEYLEEAEKVSALLKDACDTYATNVLQHGRRKVEKTDINNFVKQLTALSHYWSILETKFHKMLSNYTLDKNPYTIHSDWLLSVKYALSDAWALHRHSIDGGDAWAIRAFVKADGIIGKKIIELNKDIQTLKEVS